MQVFDALLSDMFMIGLTNNHIMILTNHIMVFEGQ